MVRHATTDLKVHQLHTKAEDAGTDAREMHVLIAEFKSRKENPQKQT